MAAGVGDRGEIGVLVLEMAQDVLQRILDPAEIAGARIGRCLDALQQIGHALFEMRERRCIVVADRHAVDAIGQRAQRALDIFRIARRPPAARGSPATSSARRCAARARRRRRCCCRRNGRSGRPWTTASARRRKAAPARRWRRHWRRSSEVPRSRLRADERWRDRHWCAGSGRAWRRDCGSRRHSRRAVRPASASAALRGFRPARVRHWPAPGRRWRSGGCRRCGATASGFRSRSIRSPGAASPR